MLEQHQLRIEDAAASFVGRLRRIHRLTAWGRRFAFWRLPALDVVMPSNGIWRRDDVFSNVHASSAYRDLTNQLFHEDFRDREQGVQVEGVSADAVELVEQNFIPFRRYKHRPQGLDVDKVYWGSTSAPDDFISTYMAGAVLTKGKQFFSLNYSVLEGKSYITRIRPLINEDVRLVRIGRRRGQYRYVWRPQPGWGDGDAKPRIEYFLAHEVARFEYPESERVGRATMRKVLGLMREDDELMARMQVAAYATANPNDRRTVAERARRLNISRLVERATRAGWRISASWGGLHGMELTQTSTTAFYSAYAEAKYRRWVAAYRESMCEQFTQQVVKSLLSQNGLPLAGARLVPHGLRSSNEWEHVRQQLITAQMSPDDALALVYPSLKKSAERAATAGATADTTESTDDAHEERPEEKSIDD